MPNLQEAKSRIMYIERKGRRDHSDNAPARIGKVTFTKSGKTICYRGKTYSRANLGCGNYREKGSGDEYWISGCKRNGGDRLFPGIIEIDDDVREEYWTEIRRKPECKKQAVIRCTGKHGGKQGRRR